jgi:arylsulfatase A-like enzyme
VKRVKDTGSLNEQYKVLNPVLPTIPTFLKPLGYHTQVITFHPYFNSFSNLTKDFDFRDEDQVNARLPLHIQNVRTWLNRLKDEKFFLHLHIIPPHTPYVAVAPHDEAFIDYSDKLFETKGFKLYYSESDNDLSKWADGAENKSIYNHLSNLYDASIALADEYFGKCIKELKNLGLYDNSFIIFSSDHGEQFWEHGNLGHAHSLHNEEVHIPMIIKLPSNTDIRILNKEVDTPVINIDFLPTILGVNGIESPDFLQGKNLLDLANHQLSYINRDFLYLFQAYHTFEYEGVIHNNYKYIYSKKTNSEALYDLQNDPGEMNNIVTQEIGVTETMRAILGNYEENVFWNVKNYTTHKSNHGFENTEKKGEEKNNIENHDETLEKLKGLGYIK